MTSQFATSATRINLSARALGRTWWAHAAAASAARPGVRPNHRALADRNRMPGRQTAATQRCRLPKRSAVTGEAIRPNLDGQIAYTGSRWIDGQRAQWKSYPFAGDRLIVIAHRRRAEALAHAGLEPLGLHQPRDPLPADRNALLDQVWARREWPSGASSVEGFSTAPLRPQRN